MSKGQEIDVQFYESSAPREPVSTDIHNAASICTAELEDGPQLTGRQLVSTQGTSTESLRPHVS